jgi:transposase
VITVKSLNVSQAVLKANELLKDEKSLSESAKSTIQTLIDAVTLLSTRLGMNSNNSSIPPSMDPNRARKKRQSKGIKRKPGGQNGHKGTTLKKVDNPNEVEEITIDRRTIPQSFYKTVGYESRQVFDINISLWVKEYRSEIVENHEGEQWVAEFPEGVTKSAQYGNHTKASSVYLSQFQLVPLDRVRNYFEDQAGIPISKGSIANFNVEASERLEAFENWAKEQLISSKLNHADETGINVGGEKLWLHNMSNDKVTLFHADEKRGSEAMDRMGVLPFFKGVLCHDHWKAYFKYECMHSLCNAHHLRELEWCEEFESQNWAKKMQVLLIEINDEKIKNGSITTELQSHYQKKYREILKQGQKECPFTKKPEGRRGRTAKSKSRNLLERLLNFEAETLRFMREPNVPFTNNQGENDIRMTKVQQKISGCFRSMEGAKNFCRIRSYISTCRKNNFNLTEALTLLFEGKLPTFIT